MEKELEEHERLEDGISDSGTLEEADEGSASEATDAAENKEQSVYSLQLPGNEYAPEKPQPEETEAVRQLKEYDASAHQLSSGISVEPELDSSDLEQEIYEIMCEASGQPKLMYSMQRPARKHLA